MPVKLLVVGQPNSGKTTLLKSLDVEDTLVISRDGKVFPLPLRHKNIVDFSDVDDLITQIGDVVQAYVTKYDTNPKTIVIDSVSKILLDIEARILSRVKSFPYGVINTEISKFTDFMEEQLAPVCNLVIVSHSIFNTETNNYELVNAGGSWGKKGGMLSEVNNSVFIEIKGKKRIIHHRSPQLAARTTLDDMPDSTPLEEYNLQEHLTILEQAANTAADFEL